MSDLDELAAAGWREMRRTAVAESWDLRDDAAIDHVAHLVATHTPADDWWDHRACVDMPIDVFFPDSDRREHYDRCRAVCASCPVRLDCLTDHLDEQHGCWGGTSPKDRRTLRSRVARARWADAAVHHSTDSASTSRRSHAN